jgi:uncharacterized membrane protein YhaH (DUF805 family)
MDAMQSNARAPEGKRGRRRDWLDPTRLYNPTVPAGRLTFLWGLAIYPLAVMFVLLTVIIIIIESFVASANVGDYIGIFTWVFMLGWVVAIVAICRRRLLDLGKSQSWIWVVILPGINLILFAYLLFKSGPVASRQAA